MHGAICVNEWLADEGYLVLAERPTKVTPFSDVEVDWGSTRAWGEGGYYCRLCLNVRGREPQGIVEPDEVEPLLRRADRSGSSSCPDRTGRRSARGCSVPSSCGASGEGSRPT